ncbi:MAG: hypothetical protein JSV80_00275, partial [Acidobacteriota bacterium]
TSLGLKRVAIASETGDFTIDRLAPGLVDVVVAFPGPEGDTLFRRRVEIRDGETTDFAMSNSPPLRVRVVEGGEPRPDVAVVLIGIEEEGRARVVSDAVSNEDGVAIIPRASPIDSGALVGVREADAALFTRLSQLPSEDRSGDVRTLVIDGQRLRGRVVAAIEKSAVSGALLSCSRKGAGISRRRNRQSPLYFHTLGTECLADRAASLAASGQRGQFEMWLPEWCQWLEVNGPPTRGQELPWHPVQLDVEQLAQQLATGEPIEIPLERGRLILVRYTFSDNHLSAPVEISLLRPGQTWQRRSVRSQTGSARLEPDDEGPWQIVARAEGFARAVAGPLSVPEGAPLEIELLIERGGTIAVHGIGPDAEHGLASLQILDARGSDWAMLADAMPLADGDGIEIGPLPTGRYQIIAGGVKKTVNIRFAGDRRVVAAR